MGPGFPAERSKEFALFQLFRMDVRPRRNERVYLQRADARSRKAGQRDHDSRNEFKELECLRIEHACGGSTVLDAAGQTLACRILGQRMQEQEG